MNDSLNSLMNHSEETIRCWIEFHFYHDQGELERIFSE